MKILNCVAQIMKFQSKVLMKEPKVRQAEENKNVKLVWK